MRFERISGSLSFGETRSVWCMITDSGAHEITRGEGSLQKPFALSSRGVEFEKKKDLEGSLRAFNG